MSGRRLTEAEALEIHAVLVELAHANDGEDARRDFARHATRGADAEYRFQGRLGFGGKFYWDGREARIGFYRESGTELRQAIVDCAKPRLAAILGLPRPPEPDPHALLALCATAMAATSDALAEADRLRLSRGESDPALRPVKGAMRAVETRVRMTRDALDAALLRAREALARRATPGAGEA